MEEYDEEKWSEQLNKVYGRNDTTISEEEINSFMQRIEKVGSILNKMSSTDSETVKFGMAQADEMLAGCPDGVEINENEVKIKKDRVLINKNAFKEEQNQPLEIEAFKRSVEVDANRRAEERRQRKEVAERHKIQGNKSFRSGDYSKAIYFYNKAIDEVKDSCLLYTNRALTFLRIELPEKAIEDAEKALKLNEFSLKGLLYKAQALHLLNQDSDARIITAMALEKHSQHKDYILEYAKEWYKDPDNMSSSIIN